MADSPQTMADVLTALASTHDGAVTDTSRHQLSACRPWRGR
jgi:hypothetical protein